jgi:hexosaminidase
VTASSDAFRPIVKLHFHGKTVIALLALGLFPALLRAQQPQLVPQPREVQAAGQSFEVKPETEIVLSPATAAEDRFAAESLQEELRLVTGHQCSIVSSPSSPQAPAIHLGRFGDPVVNRAQGDAAGVGAQGYVLDVEPSGVTVAGSDGPGLFYGVQTLRELVVADGEGAKILGVRVRDWPSLLYRGAQVDMARGPVPNLTYLKRVVRTIAEFKMNQLYMYMEDSFRLDGEPLVGVLSDTLSRDDWKELVAYAATYHVDIVPATEACGHLHKVLRFDQYSGLGERPHGHGLAGDDPQALAFLDRMYQQMAPVFPTSFYHVGCDETFDLGLGRSAQRVATEGYGQVYVENLAKVADLVHRYNKQVMFWGDIAVEHPEMISRLPKDLIVASWEYGAHPSYDKWLKPFAGTGMKLVVCPWVANTGVIMADYEQAAANIEGFLTDGKKAGAIGTDITAWNDSGETLYGLGWWSIVYGAACAWESGKTPVDDFNRKFDWVFYRNTDHRFAEAIERLSRVNETMRGNKVGQMYDMDYGGTSDALFWHDPFSASGRIEVNRALPVAPEMRQTAEQAYGVFVNSASRARRNADTLANLEFAALKIDALGMRYEYVQEISQLYANAEAHQNDKAKQDLVGNELEEIDSTNGRLQDLRDYTTRLRELYRQLWLSENLPDWLPNILQLYDRNSQMWQDRISSFARIESEHGDGKPLPPADSLGLLPVTVK